jgi:hypothetical protein
MLDLSSNLNHAHAPLSVLDPPDAVGGLAWAVHPETDVEVGDRFGIGRFGTFERVALLEELLLLGCRTSIEATQAGPDPDGRRDPIREFDGGVEGDLPAR